MKATGPVMEVVWQWRQRDGRRLDGGWRRFSLLLRHRRWLDPSRRDRRRRSHQIVQLPFLRRSLRGRLSRHEVEVIASISAVARSNCVRYLGIEPAHGEMSCMKPGPCPAGQPVCGPGQAEKQTRILGQGVGLREMLDGLFVAAQVERNYALGALGLRDRSSPLPWPAARGSESRAAAPQ